MLIRCALVMVVCLTASAQTLEVTPAAVDRGSANILRIVLKPSVEKPIAALQWYLVYREGLRIEPSGVVAGSASEAAGNSVTCAPKPSDGANHRLVCIIAGGVQALPAGAIAIVRFEAAKDTPAGKMNVDLEKVIGVSPSLESVPMEGTKVSITIR